MFRMLLPRGAAILLLFIGAIFTFSESIYLQDQSAEIGPDASKIGAWMWVFRAITLLFALAAFLILGNTVRRYLE